MNSQGFEGYDVIFIICFLYLLYCYYLSFYFYFHVYLNIEGNTGKLDVTTQSCQLDNHKHHLHVNLKF
jgi:hypothetical protein